MIGLMRPERSQVLLSPFAPIDRGSTGRPEDFERPFGDRTSQGECLVGVHSDYDVVGTRCRQTGLRRFTDWRSSIGSSLGGRHA